MIEIKRIVPKSTTDVKYCAGCAVSTRTVAVTEVTFGFMPEIMVKVHLCDWCLRELKEKINNADG